MGTQIQSETYFLRHCLRNYSRNIGTGRCLSYQDGKVPENSQHEHSSSPMDRYSGHGKVKVKETMLEHEVTFRRQVRELHRLYRRQRELMNEIQDNRLYILQKKTDSSQSVISPSYLSSERAKRTRDGFNFLSSESNVLSKGRNYLNEPFQFLSSSPSVKSFCHLSRHADELQKWNLTDNISSAFFLHKETSQNSMPAMNGRILLNRSPSGYDGNGKELKSHGFKLSTDLSLHVEHKTESRKKRKIFGVEIPEEVDESSLVSSDANNSYPISNGAESDTSNFLSGKAFANNLSKKASSPQGSHGATTSELSWLKLGLCLQNLEFAGGMGAREDLKSSVSKCELFHRSSLCVRSQLNPELADGGAEECLDTLKGKNAFTSLPGLLEFQDSSNCWKSVNLTELKSANFLKSDSEITNISENVSHNFFRITERTGIQSKKSYLELSAKYADDKKDGHVRVDFPSTEGISKADAMDLPTDAVSKKCPTKFSANSSAPDKSLSNHISGLRNHIDLDLSIYKEEAPEAAILPDAVVKIIRPEIDLEVPGLIDSEVEHGGTKFLDKSEEPHQYSINEAAEALVLISATLTCATFENASNCICWLANVICSYASGEDGVVREISQTIDGCDEEAVPRGMDYFEFMTLQLTDMKEETYCYCLSDMEHQKAEETEKYATKRRFGRRGRQQKDFQKDVLPDLVSLAKQEVVEDLHTLEELFHSTGKTWKSSLSRRNNAKKGRRSMKSGESLNSPEADPAKTESI